MKDAVNGSQNTPKVRLSILNPGYKDVINRPEKEFPLYRKVSLPLYLDAKSNTMAYQPGTHPLRTSFEAVNGMATFVHTFPKRTELTDFFKLRIQVQAIGNDDIDFFAKFSKLSAQDDLLEVTCIGCGYQQDDLVRESEKLRFMHAHFSQTATM